MFKVKLIVMTLNMFVCTDRYNYTNSLKKKGVKMGKKSQTTTNTVYGNTTTKNPYAWAKTDNSGTLSGFQDKTALNSVYNFVNNSIDSLLDQYLNPTLNSSVNQAKMNSFVNTLNSQTKKNLENNIINPLSARNMLRSSQASDLYKNLSNQNASSLAD